MAELRLENAKLRKIARVLTDRVERNTDTQGTAFSLFQAAITLEETVRKRTAELLALNDRLRREIDERLQAENALRLATLDAERANAGKTKFLAAASHDVLQPLNVARLFLDALLERERDPKNVELAKHVEEALASANDVLSTLLDISKLDAGALVPEIVHVSIGPILRRIANEYGLQAEERGLRFRLVPCETIVRTDPHLLERLLRNLVSNAVKYTSRGGVLVGCRRRGSMLRIEVWDTGAGISDDRIDEAFEEFRRLEITEQKGIGLGLSIVRRIADLLGIRIAVRTRLGKGSMFAAEVPLAMNGSRLDAARADSPAYLDPLNGKTIAVLDDDPRSLEGLSFLLRSWGCRTLEALNIESMRSALRASRHRPDLIVADYHLGHDSTGLEAVELVRSECAADPAAIILTADRLDDVHRKIVRSGAYLLYKPVRAERLRALLVHIVAAT